MIEAANKYNVHVQVGYGNRASNSVWGAICFLHSGGIGKVYMARGLCYKQRNSFGMAPDSAPPVTFHYDLWLGPAAYQAYNEKKIKYNWHWFWNMGNGDTGNQGSHQFDVARWGLNKNEHPVSVYSTGGIYGWSPDECSQETPDTQTSVFKYEDGVIIEFETRERFTNGEASQGVNIGNLFYGTEGYLELDNNGSWKAFRNNEKEPFAGSEQQKSSKSDEPERVVHGANFVDVIRSGKNDDLYCSIIDGHYSLVLPLLSNISYRLGRGLKFMGEYEKFSDDAEANFNAGP